MQNEEDKPDTPAPRPRRGPERAPIGFTVSVALSKPFRALAYIVLVCTIIAVLTRLTHPAVILIGLLAFAAFISLSEASTSL